LVETEKIHKITTSTLTTNILPNEEIKPNKTSYFVKFKKKSYKYNNEIKTMLQMIDVTNSMLFD
jgi:hypothetical protein